jgi:hypothetical protein
MSELRVQSYTLSSTFANFMETFFCFLLFLLNFAAIKAAEYKQKNEKIPHNPSGPPERRHQSASLEKHIEPGTDYLLAF